MRVKLSIAEIMYGTLVTCSCSVISQKCENIGLKSAQVTLILPCYICCIKRAGSTLHCVVQTGQYNELSYSHIYIFATQWRRPKIIIQIINFVRSNNQSLKYQRFTPTSCKDKGITKFECVAKT